VMKQSDQKILLIDPPFFRFMGEGQYAPPLGLCYLASYCRSKGFSNLVVYNADFDPFVACSESSIDYAKEKDAFETYQKSIEDLDHPLYREVLERIEKEKPDLIGISVKISKVLISKNLIALIKRKNRDIPIVLGGPHVTARVQEILERTEADFAVKGEGEETFYNLLEAIFSKSPCFEQIDGLSYKENGRIFTNKDRDLIGDLDVIPFPAKDALLFHDKLPKDILGGLFSTRGCPFNCTFCDSRATWSRKVRYRSAQNIVDEIRFTKKRFGSAFFSFSDDCFATSKKRTMELCDLLIKSGLAKLPRIEFRWWCEIHPRFVDREVISKMKEAGCVALVMGVESGSDEILGKVNKSLSGEVVREAAKIIKEHGIEFGVFCMIGFPWETTEDIQTTFDLISEIDADSVNISIFTPLPNTEIYSECLTKGLIDYDADYSNCFFQRGSHFYSECINDAQSKEVIEKYFHWVEEYNNRKRHEKLAKYLRAKIVPSLFMELPALSYEELILRYEQDYAKRKLSVTLKVDVDDGVVNRLCDLILTDQPQYYVIEIKNKGDEIIKRASRPEAK
jgi:anaerobic magnesium-protoporphyrin IX monomethyl ester cyclase